LNNSIPQLFRTGCSYTQTSIQHAVAAGLKAHPRLIGRSRLANGTMKSDYLCETAATLMDVDFPLVVKVGREQPCLLGLDAMILLSMHLQLAEVSFSISTTPAYSPVFRFLKFEELLHHLQITRADLVPIQELPPPHEAYKRMVAAGTSQAVFDLGTPFFTIPSSS